MQSSPTYPAFINSSVIFIISTVTIARENRKRKKPAISSLNDIQPELLKVLYNLPPDFEIHVRNAEEKSGVKREHDSKYAISTGHICSFYALLYLLIDFIQFVYGLSGFLVLYMIIGSEAGLFCNIICFTYPAIVSIQANHLREGYSDNVPKTSSSSF
ncbi:hypothetical protein LOAG_04673 [Loa loa]|uniref:Uncharacterized protein n=1 Tax=Loa loa TaxID=7209 RepID=A0A1S0U1I8_LOALO|nr:hypothetical protein LOAG_04673 [Loa loa]EFO23807.1 hypothetical protein LOAG_04673 [Loa loa]